MKSTFFSKNLTVLCSLIVTINASMYGMQLPLKKLSDTVVPGANLNPDFQIDQTELQKNLNTLNRLCADYSETFVSQKSYFPLINTINNQSYVANILDAWKITKLDEYIRNRTGKKGPLFLQADHLQRQEYFEGPLTYDNTKDGSSLATNHPKFMIHHINQFFCKGCPDDQTKKFIGYIIDLNSSDPSKKLSITDSEANNILAQQIKTITTNKDFQEVCEFIVNGPSFKEKSNLIAALNKLGTKQYKDPHSSSSSNTKTLVGTGIVIFGFIAWVIYMWKNNPDFFNRTPFSSSLRA